MLIDVFIALFYCAITFLLRAKLKVVSRARSMLVVQKYVIELDWLMFTGVFLQYFSPDACSGFERQGRRTRWLASHGRWNTGKRFYCNRVCFQVCQIRTKLSSFTPIIGCWSRKFSRASARLPRLPSVISVSRPCRRSQFFFIALAASIVLVLQHTKERVFVLSIVSNNTVKRSYVCRGRIPSPTPG